MPTPEQQAYAKELERISKRFGSLEDETIRSMTGMLQDLRRGLAAELMLITDEEGFQAHRLRELQAGIGRTIDEFEAQLSAQMRGDFGEAYELGGRSATDPLAAAGVAAFYQPLTAQVNAIQDFSADLIQNIGNDLRGKINNRIRLATLGQQSPFQAMRAVTQDLGIKAKDGVWGRRRRPETVRGVAARAETIVRTELSRVYNLSHHSQQQITAEEIPEVRKRWVATADARTRDSHLAAHIRYKAEPIPVNEPFIVGGHKLMFPGDPSGPPEETINERCRVITIHPDIGPIDTPLDKAIEEERAKRAEDEAKPKEGPPPEKPPERPIPELEADYQQEVKEARAARDDAFSRGATEEAEGIGSYLDEMERVHADERDQNRALWDAYGITPDQATEQQWRFIAGNLRAEGYDLYKKYTKEGIRLHVSEQRAAKDAGYADVGGKVVQVKRGRFSVRAAQRMEGEIWSEGKEDLRDAYGKLLKRAGYRPSDIDKASFEQRARLLAELGDKEITRTKRGAVSKIDDVSPDRREVVVSAVEHDLAATCGLAAIDPLATPSIDAYRKMELADMIESTRLESP